MFPIEMQPIDVIATRLAQWLGSADVYGRSRRILDDLERLGYEVLEVGALHEALRLVAEAGTVTEHDPVHKAWNARRRQVLDRYELLLLEHGFFLGDEADV